MSARVLRFAGSQHHQAERLLPWLVNGTLDADEREQVVRHVDGCAHCQRELAAQHALHDVCAVPAPAIDPLPSFLRLRRRLRAPPRALPPASSPWRAARTAWVTAPWWLRGAVAAQCALLLALAGAWLGHEEPAARYRTLGDSSAMVVPAVGEARLVVVFEPGISQARTQQLLRASQARIVDGPSDAGAYVLAMAAARAATVCDALRAAPGVRLVERLDRDSATPAAAR